MPELPEVETIRLGLQDHLVGSIITAIEVRAPKIFIGEPKDIIGKTIQSLQRQGKLLLFMLSNEYVLTIHLKMTGQLIWKPKPAPGLDLDKVLEMDNAELPYDSEDDSEEDEDLGVVMGGHPEKVYLDSLPHKHTHIIMHFNDGSTLYFNDLRKFGRFTVMKQSDLSEVVFLQNLGPEPLSQDFTVDYLEEQLAKRPKVAIKTFLLDQANIAGLGNIYADESLFRAFILPERTPASLSKGESRNLHDAIQETIELALKYGGSSSKDYLNAVGEKGTFLKIANVYHRTGQDCNRCNTGIIVRKKINGRSSHYCENCQR